MGVFTRSEPSLFGDQQFLRVWAVGCLTGVVRWLELLAFGLYAFDSTASPVLVALLALLRFAPLAIFGVFVGAVADLFDARKLLLGGLAGIVLGSRPANNFTIEKVVELEGKNHPMVISSVVPLES